MPDQVEESFDRLLSRYRTAAGLTQAELAERAGISVEAISTLERGKRRLPRWTTVGLLADALSLDEEGRELFLAAVRHSREVASDRREAEDTRPHNAQVNKSTATSVVAVEPWTSPQRRPFVTRHKQGTFRLATIAAALLAAFGWLTTGRPWPMASGQKTASSIGHPIAMWGNAFDRFKPLRAPEGIALAPGGDVYVTDSRNNCVDRFTSTGQLVAQWGTFGVGPGNLHSPRGIAVDQHGNVYVADYGNNRIEKFSPEGKAISVWPEKTIGTNFPFPPSGIAVDSRGYVYAVSRGIGGVQVRQFSPGGRPVPSWGPANSDFLVRTRHATDSAPGIALDWNGNIFLTDAGSGEIRALAPGGSGLWAWTYSSLHGIASPGGIAAGARGRFYVPDRRDGYIRAFSRTGRLLAKFGSWGSSLGQFRSPAGIATGPQGQLYVADSGNSRIQVLSSDGRPISVWRGRPSSLGSLHAPQGIAVDAHGTVFVSDAGNHRIQAFTPQGRGLAEWGEGVLQYPEGLAVDAHDNLYVADLIGDHIVKFSARHVAAV